MKGCTFFLALVTLWLAAGAVCGQVPLGNVAAVFPYDVSKVLADPVRPRVYLAVPQSNTILAVDTRTLTVVGVLPTGASPIDMAIRPEGDLLYVLNGDSASETIDEIDLDAFTELNSFPVGMYAQSIAAGSGGRVYVGGIGFEPDIYQVDGITGEIQDDFVGVLSEVDFLQTTPDGNTLFAAQSEGGGVIESFDVSTPSAVPWQTNSLGLSILQLALSHDGAYLCAPAVQRNPHVFDDYITPLFSTADITNSLGGVRSGEYPARLAFSPDDALIYQTVTWTNALYIFDTQTSTLLHQIALPPVADADNSSDTRSITVDNTGSYLFVCQDSSVEIGTYYAASVGQVLVLGTGLGTATPAPTPTVEISATVPDATAGSGLLAYFTVSRAGGDISQPLTVHYAIKGTAQNGVDYTLIRGRVRIASGMPTGTVKIVPADAIARPAKTVRLVLRPGSGYDLGTSTQATVRIKPGR